MEEIICQAWIVFFGGSAIFLVGRLESWKKWGYFFGLCSQPAWFYTAWKNEQWGIFILSVWYTLCWTQGIYNYWIIPNQEFMPNSKTNRKPGWMAFFSKNK